MGAKHESADEESNEHEIADRSNEFVVLPLSGGITRLLSSLETLFGPDNGTRLLFAAGYEEANRDWFKWAAFSTFEEGFAHYAQTAHTEGWGRLTLVSLDRVENTAHFRVEGSSASTTPWGKHLIAGKLAGLCSKCFHVACSTEMRIKNGDDTSVLEFFITPSNNPVVTSFDEELAREHSRAAATKETLAMLEEEVRERREAEENLKFEVEERKIIEENLKFEVAERSEMEHELRQKLRLIVEQQEAIHRMSVPIIHIWDGVLAVPIIGPLSAERATEMTDKLLNELASTGARNVLIDLTGAELADSATAEHVLRIAQAVQLMGARGLITGIQPAAARAMISAGIDLSRIKTFGNLRDGLKECMKATRPRS